MTLRQIEVVAAVIVRDGLVLGARRSARQSLSGLWEFPGGKVEPDEVHSNALAREIREELACEVKVGELVLTDAHEYEFGEVQLSTYWCTLKHGEPYALEHAEVRWLHPRRLQQLEWAPADLSAVEAIVNKMP
ncbi:(deoxy)nucleoside triphosphate pyrophosphohydrolase [Agromyces protaetiae]|uniref:8-oxo-dGTP diphosphatase n=1 Tax=Agromyces protaetiae TaxID=2509455 RepID=A0A4P6F9X7_9MICO|nr:(deoxy)nucleoside triphosphate pyrophosphohydrolase [Agromyces protaetiae]QAY72990.1 (deoxy)nucleoside triphosphate pyrophosphohydrolase [Agromyces protaetiae]